MPEPYLHEDHDIEIRQSVLVSTAMWLWCDNCQREISREDISPTLYREIEQMWEQRDA